jgi:hypothetical protein
LTVVAGGAAGTFYLCGNNNRLRAARDEAFEAICQRYTGLRPARHTEIVGDSVGTIPWFMSEEWIHAYGMACGEYQGQQIAIVECTHVVDPILATTDSKWMQGLSGLVSKKHQRLHLRAMEATVFVRPLENVSDLVFVPQTDPSRAYYKRALSNQPCDLSHVFKLPHGLRNKYWMAAAAPQECEGLFATQLPALLNKRKWCIVQVVGGYCAVLTSHWHGNQPWQAPKTEAAIAENLDFAHSVYQQLQQFDAAVPAAASQTDTYPAAVDTTRQAHVPATAAPVATAKPAVLKKQGNRRPHSLLARLLLFGFGIPLFLFGALGLLGGWVGVSHGRASQEWPQVDAVVVTSRIHASNSGRFSPRVTYQYEVDGQKYTNDKIQYGPTERSRDKREVERVLAKYPKGGAVKAYYHPRRPHQSVLIPGVKDESTMFGLMIFTGCLMAIGLLMCGCGALGKKRPPGL